MTSDGPERPEAAPSEGATPSGQDAASDPGPDSPAAVASAAAPASAPLDRPSDPSVPVTPPHGTRPSAASLPPGPAILEIRGLTKSYGNVHALRGVDLTVRQGEVYGFLGRNGAGKSTTIRILMGITEKTGGTVALFGQAPGKTDLVRARQRIGYVAQEQSFYGWMTPSHLGRFVGAFYPTWDDHEYRRVCALLELPVDRKIQGFSGGMRVKVALALALAHRPPLLLLDEPTAGLDPVARREFLEIVKSEAKASGRTTFFSSHLIDEVELVAQRVGIVDGGKTRYEGSVRALGERVRLLARPVSGALSMLTAALTSRGLRVLFTEEQDGEERAFVEADDPALFSAALAEHGVSVRAIDLEEIFIAMVRRSPGAARA